MQFCKSKSKVEASPSDLPLVPYSPTNTMSSTQSFQTKHMILMRAILLSPNGTKIDAKETLHDVEDHIVAEIYGDAPYIPKPTDQLINDLYSGDVPADEIMGFLFTLIFHPSVEVRDAMVEVHF